MRRISLLGAACVCLLAAGLTGCGSSSSGGDRTRVRVLNAAAGLANQPVDVQVNQTTQFRNVAYGTSTDPVEVDAGNARIDVFNAGTTTPDITNAMVTLQKAVDQTLLITGKAGAAAPNNLTVSALSAEDLSDTPTQGQVRIRFIHAAPEAGSANFSYTVNGGAAQTNADLTNVPYLQTVPPQFPTFGSTVFTAVVGGETVTSTPVTTQGTKTYTVVLIGRPAAAGGNPSLGLMVFKDN